MISIKPYLFIFAIFLLAVLVILYSWFNSHQVISNSEEALNIVNVRKTAQDYSTVWSPGETGIRSPFNLIRFPSFAILATIKNLGFRDFMIQAFFIGISMVLGLISMFLLLKKIFPDNFMVALIGSFFYLLNLFSMSQVFRRFLYTSMYAWAYLPLFLLLWIKILENKNLIYLSIFLISSVIFTISLGQPAYLFAFWISAAVFVFVKLWALRKSKKKFLMTILLSISAFCLWAIVNSWWLYPTMQSSGVYLTEIKASWQTNFESLKAVSKSFPIGEILLLRQSWWFGEDNHWFNFYSSPAVLAISLITLAITIYGFIKSKKHPIWPYLTLLAFVGLFISKGTNSPFGGSFYYFTFSNFPLSGALRNSYEKFGLTFLLAYSCFFAYGMYQLTKIFNKKLSIIILFFLLTSILGILVWPMWSGSIFLPHEKVTIPSYYKEANNYLNLRSNSRIFHLPLSKSANVIYSWGYMGQDPSESLFDRDSISRPEFVQLQNVLYKDLLTLVQNENFPKILGSLGVGEIIIHNDAKPISEDLLISSEGIENWEGLYDSKEFGDLRIYSIKKEYVRPRIYLIQYNSTALINFKKISNARYLVFVKNSQKPFTLVLNNSFDKAWTARIDFETLNNHFLINGFANGWFVDKKGDYTIKLFLKVWPWE